MESADEDRRAVARVLAGDVETFAALVDRHQGRIVAHLRRLVGAADAEDLAQDTFLRAYQALDRFDPIYPFRGWLLVIASRLAANHRARRREARFAEDGEAALPGRGGDPAQLCAEADAEVVLRARLETAVAALDADARVLYELRFRQELEPAELAHHFGITRNALKVRVHRLRQVLAAHLGITVTGEDEIMDTDDRLRHLIDHPLRDAEAPRDPLFTAQVMAGLRPRPAAVRGGHAWWAVAAVAAVAALALPFADEPGVTMGTGDLLLLGEIALAALLLAVPAAVVARNRP